MTFVFLFIAAQGFFLSFLLFSKKRDLHNSNLFIGSFILLFSIILLFWIGYWNEFPFKYVHFNFIYNSLPLLLGPLFFYYVKSNYQRPGTKDLLHLIPILIVLLYFCPFYFLSGEEKILLFKENNLDDVLWNWKTVKYLAYPLDVFSFIFYGFWSYSFIKSKDSSIPYFFIYKDFKNPFYLTLSFFNIFIMFATISYLSMIILNAPYYVDFLFSIFICAFIYGIGYTGISRYSKLGDLEKEPESTYSRSSLDPSSTSEKIKRLMNFLEQEKPYLHSHYKLRNLSEDIGIPSHHISELLNKYYDKNFSELINKYRVENAKELLLSEEYKNLKITSIGYDAGFNSKTSFYSWFKKLEGKSPAEFQKENS